MTRSIVFSRDGVILNACCLRNIYASGCMVAILGALPIPTMIARIAYQEQPLRIFRENKEGEGLVVEHIDLQPVLNAGLLVVTSLSSEVEEAKMRAIHEAHLRIAKSAPEKIETIPHEEHVRKRHVECPIRRE